jgi:hypothetical protein
MLKLGAAVFFDLMKFPFALVVFLEPVADIIDLAAWCVFFIWFAMTGVRMFGGPRALARLGSAAISAIAGVIPFVDIAPTITLGVAAIEYQHWKEEREQAAKKAVQTRAMRIRAQQAAYREQAARADAA